MTIVSGWFPCSHSLALSLWNCTVDLCGELRLRHKNSKYPCHPPNYQLRYTTILCGYTACASTCISPCDLSSLQQARTNVPGLSERTLQRDIASSGILTGAGIQVGCVLICMSVQFWCCYQRVCSCNLIHPYRGYMCMCVYVYTSLCACVCICEAVCVCECDVCEQVHVCSTVCVCVCEYMPTMLHIHNYS